MRVRVLPLLVTVLSFSLHMSSASAEEKKIYDQFPQHPLFDEGTSSDLCRGTWTFESFGFCEDENHPWDQQVSEFLTTGQCAQGVREYDLLSCQDKSHRKIPLPVVLSGEFVHKGDSVAGVYLEARKTCAAFEAETEQRFKNESGKEDTTFRSFLEIGKVKDVANRWEKKSGKHKYVFNCEVQPFMYRKQKSAACGPDLNSPKGCYVLTKHQTLSSPFCANKVLNVQHSSYEPGMSRSHQEWVVNNDSRKVVPSSFVCNTGDHLPISNSAEIQAKVSFLFAKLEKDKTEKKLRFEDSTIIKRSIEGLFKDHGDDLTQDQRDTVQKMIEADLSGKITLGGKADHAKFSSKGNLLATADSTRGTLTIWDIAMKKGTPIKAITSEKSFDISSNGSFVAYSTETDIALYDPKTKAVIRTLSGHGKAHIVKISADSKTIVAAHGMTVVKWDVETGTALNVKTKAFKTNATTGEVIERDLQWIEDLQLTPDNGNLLIGNRDSDQVVIMSYPDWEELSDFPYYDRFALSANGEVLITQRSGVATISNISGGSLSDLIPYDNSPNGIAGIAISPDGKTAAIGGWNGSIRLLHQEQGYANPVELQGLTQDDAGAYGIDKVMFSADGRYLVASGSTSQKRKVWIYSLAMGTVIREIEASAQAGAVALHQRAVAVGVDAFSIQVFQLP